MNNPIADKFNGVWVFTSGLKSGHLGADVVIVMNSSLAKHVCKVSEVLGQLLSIKLLFKNKLLVSILGLYTGASSAIQFSQTGDINSLIARAVNESSFLILGGDFNEDGSHKCASFKKCLDLELVNSLVRSLVAKKPTWANSRGVEKTINYVQRFNIPDGIEVVKKSVYQYIENRINNYLFGNYNISEVRSNLYNNLAHYSQLETEDLNSKTLATYFYKLNFNIIKYCEETYLVQSQYTIDFESETETSNKGKNKLKQYSRTTPNTPTLPKTTANHLQTSEQGTSSKLPLTITSFLVLLAQAQTPNSPLNQFARPEDFTSLRSLIRQQEPLQTSSNFLDFLAENQSEHSETAANEENKPEISEEESIDSENKENEMTTYIAKIPEFNREDIETSPQEWLDQVTKAGDANGWNAARMLRTIPYFLKGTAGEWFENLAVPFNDWNAFKAAFLEQFTDNNTSITLRNRFQNIKQELSESVMTYIGKFNKLLRQICQLETNNYYSNAQILDQFIAGLKDKLIKKVCLHAPEDLNSAIQHAKRYEMAMEKANHTKLVNLAIEETSSAAEKKIDQLTKKVENYFTN
ncbi:hypothetical protein G9A89_002071 [Geosiphon pyriformis]|nr:hypothetical protein G9A89_002071 [Geosiphon pyriformis]